MERLRVVIIEDEELQRAQLANWLSREEGIDLAGEAADGETAIRLIDELCPDLVLLDVSLPECTGLEVLERVHHVPEVVFTTAFRDHAVAAFELGAADYLLKPFGRERLVAALARVRERERGRDTLTAAQRLALVRDDGRPLERIFVRHSTAIVPVDVGAIVRLEADGDYTAVLTADRRFLVAVALGTLHARIGRADFVRVHRQHVVNLAHVLRLVPHDAGRLRVELRGGGSVVASRAGSQELRELVE